MWCRCLVKVRVTLSLDKDLVSRVKSRLALEGRSLSELVEDLLSIYDIETFIRDLCRGLGLDCRYSSPQEITSGRARGLRAEDIVREARYGREEHLSRY